MANKKHTKKILKVVACIASALVGLTAVGAIAHCAASETEEVSRYAWEVGAIDETGRKVESEANIVTKDYVKVDGLKAVFNDDAEISAKGYFYDKDKNFISATDVLTEDFDGTEEGAIPENAEYARFVITHNEDEEITYFEVFEYAAQLTITVNK